MIITLLILRLLLQIYLFILIGRILVEMIRSFSRQFTAPTWIVVIFEMLFVVTDPLIKPLRRVIPPVRLGNVALDVSIILAFIILQVLILGLSVAVYNL